MESRIEQIENAIKALSEQISSLVSQPVQERLVINQEGPKTKSNKAFSKRLKKYLELNPDIIKAYQEDSEFKDDLSKVYMDKFLNITAIQFKLKIFIQEMLQL
jgi:hypothetical protein